MKSFRAMHVNCSVYILSALTNYCASVSLQESDLGRANRVWLHHRQFRLVQPQAEVGQLQLERVRNVGIQQSG